MEATASAGAPRVAMLVTNGYGPDPRVRREALALVACGVAVTVVAWDRSGGRAPEERDGPLDVRRVHVPSTYGAGNRQALRLPRYWFAALAALRAIRPAVVHCHDLDTAPAGAWHARRAGARWVFDAHEAYPEMVARQVHPLVVAALRRLERWAARRADLVLAAGDRLAERLRGLGARRVVVVGNYAEVGTPRRSRADARAALGIPREAFVVAYAGGLGRGRLLLPLVRAVARRPGAMAVIAGDGPQGDALADVARERGDVRLLGHIPAEEIPGLFAAADAVWYGLDPGHGNNRYASANAFHLALAAGRPVIVSDAGDLGDVVRRERCGVLVDATRDEDVVAALDALADPAVREGMGARGRAAAEARYRWDAAAEALVAAYGPLLAGARAGSDAAPGGGGAGGP